ncbi:MAG: hypothetical protein Q8M98_11015 [Candidatus Cloacimonadaceae bacterium]|nr:hypothetical protein [Candidatus Cloacimonadaceae bacterium]
MTQEQRERKLRQQINAIRVKKFHWPLDGFKFIISGLGYGESLTALTEPRLLELKSLMLRYRSHGRPQAFTFDKQGKFMFALMKQATWTDSDLRAFMLKHYRKSHWNLLSKDERRAVIAMLQNYIKKAPVNEDENNSTENRNMNKNHKETSNGHPKD